MPGACPALPPELWETGVLARGGPLVLAPWVGADARRAAAARVQHRWRSRTRPTLRHGDLVVVRFPRAPPRQGRVLGLASDASLLCVRLLDRKCAHVFLPHPTARILRLARQHRGA
jgi:hypothetical protein